MANGAKVTGLNPDYYLSLEGNENLQIGNFVLSVSTNIARNIYLPKMSSGAKFATGSLHIYIVDATGSAATNNITVYPHADDTINAGGLGVPLVINTNSAVVDILSVGNGKWSTANYNGGSGGNGGGLTSIAYNDLVALAGAGNLTVGALYLITDFQMATYIQFSGGGVGSEEIYTGAIEPMIVQAASASEIGGTIISTVNPTDIINYSLLFNDREWDAVAGQSTGIITYREDTINKNSRDFDFRNIIFRRWETVIGSGNYDSFTNTGNGYQDFAPYPSSNCSSNKIGSILSAASGFGVPYWLDNTVFQNGFNVIGNSVELAFANTCQGLVEFNSFRILASNIVANFLANNIVGIFAGNTLSDTARGNVCLSIQSNGVSAIDQNTCNEIGNNNFTGVIQSNVGSYIIDNKSSSATVTISDNQVKEIHGNTLFTKITNNTGELILNNTRCAIIYNNVNEITDNNSIAIGLLSIKSNSGNKIIDNTHTVVGGMDIENNNVNRIINNDWGNTTQVYSNNGNDLSLNNFKGAGVFSSNSFCAFYGNTNNGNDIQKNLFMADITGLTFVPTAGMSGGSASVTLYDSIAGNVEQILTGGVISYLAF